MTLENTTFRWITIKLTPTRNDWTPSKDAMLDDLRRVMQLSPTVTRNYYRSHGYYRDRDWRAHWATFKDVVRAALKEIHGLK